MMTAVIILKEVIDCTPLLERRAAKALDLLCGAVSSPAAKSSGLSEGESINAIKKLRLSSLDEPECDEHEVYDPYCTPVWNVSSKQELEQVGLDLTEIEGLASILPFGKSSNETYVRDQLIPEIIFTLAILDYDEDKFRQFMSRLDRHPAVGVLLCEILTDSKLLEKARQFMDRESTDQKREILLEYLKENLTNLSNRNITHFVSSCEKYIATIVPKEINFIDMLFKKVSESNAIKWGIINDSDTTALTTVISHSSVVKELELRGCLDSNSIASFQDGLKNSDVKIRSLDISDNEDIDEEGFCCYGNIVKKHAVEELNMSFCDLSFGKLKSFNDASGNAKIRSLSISYNDIDEEGFHWLGNIVKKHEVEELKMTWCGLSFGKLKSFDDASGNAKIKVLDISANKDLSVDAICQLTLKVTDRLTAKRSCAGNWHEQDIRKLQDFIHIHPGGLKITLGDGLPELRSALAIPYITCTQAVGPEGGRITVGDCFIEFQPGTFTNSREVTVTASIDSSEWPEEGEVITPTLHVKSGKLQKPAKVILPTWVAPDVDQSHRVEILHFSENKWDIMQTQQLGISRFIEFQCGSFSLVLARIVGLLSLPIPMTFQPTLIYFGRTFVTALHLKDATLSKSLLREYEKNNPEVVHYNSMSLKKGDKVEISLECDTPQSGFVFDPSEPFSETVDSKLLGGSINRDRFVLKSECNARRITIYFKAGKKGMKPRPQAVDYHWEPDCNYSKDEDKPSTSASLCQKGSESAPPTINVTVARDIGGDLNQKSTGRTEDYRGAAIQNLNKGHLEISNEDSKTSVVANSHPTGPRWQC